MKTLESFFKNYFTSVFPYIVVFTASLFVPSDSDLGWHLRYGEYFFQKGVILRENIYSSQMSLFHWINSSWATDLLSYLAYHFFGFLGLSILGALVITGIFFFFTKTCRLSFFEKSVIFPLVMYLEKPFFEVSFRGQLLSLLFTGVLFFILDQFEQGKRKSLYLAVPLFILWSNFHGQFLVGLGYFGLWSLFYILNKYYSAKFNIKETMHNLIPLLTVFILCIASTLINPFGTGVISESVKHFGNPLQKFIIEWTPFDRFSLLWWKLVFWDILVFIGTVIIISKRKFLANLHYIIPTMVFLVLSFYVRRYTWTMLLISIPIVRHLVLYVESQTDEIKNTLSYLLFFFFYGYVIMIKTPAENVVSFDWYRYCYQYVKCSPQSAQFLENFQPKGKMMTFYNWGGYLIWNYPKITPSIDGRMHLWRDEKGYSAFVQYYPYEQNWVDIDASDYDTVYMTPNKPLYQRLLTLVKESKWKIAYQDAYAGVFTRNKPL